MVVVEKVGFFLGSQSEAREEWGGEGVVTGGDSNCLLLSNVYC